MERNRRTWIAIGAGCASGVMLAAAAPGWLTGWIAWVALAPAAAVAIAWRGSRAGRLALPLAYGVYLELLLIRALPFGIAAGQWGDPPPVMIGVIPAAWSFFTAPSRSSQDLIVVASTPALAKRSLL